MGPRILTQNLNIIIKPTRFYYKFQNPF